MSNLRAGIVVGAGMAALGGAVAVLYYRQEQDRKQMAADRRQLDAAIARVGTDVRGAAQRIQELIDREAPVDDFQEEVDNLNSAANTLEQATTTGTQPAPAPADGGGTQPAPTPAPTDGGGTPTP